MCVCLSACVCMCILYITLHINVVLHIYAYIIVRAYLDLAAFSFTIVSCIPFSLLPYGFNFLLTEEPHLAVLSVRDVFENEFTLALE